MSEAENLAAIRMDVGLENDVRLFRNNSGVGYFGKVVGQTSDTVTLLCPRRIVFGVGDGGSDLIGMRRMLVTPAMVGTHVALFSAIEVKDKGKPTHEQTKFIEFVNFFGGLAGVAHTPDETRAILRLPRESR